MRLVYILAPRQNLKQAESSLFIPSKFPISPQALLLCCHDINIGLYFLLQNSTESIISVKSVRSPGGLPAILQKWRSLNARSHDPILRIRFLVPKLEAGVQAVRFQGSVFVVRMSRGGGALPLLRQRGCAPSLGVFFKEKFSYWVWNLSKISLNEVWIFVKISLNDHFSVKNSLILFFKFKLSTQTEWNIHIGY